MTEDAVETIEAPLLARLAELAIAAETVRHPPLHTVAESQALRGDLDGAHIKNLFLRDKKRTMWLVTVLEDKPVDLKALRPLIGARGTLSFGNAELLHGALDVAPGAVTPFAVMNDVAGAVAVVLDRDVLMHAQINAHPLHNAATTALATRDLIRFLEACGHPPLLVDIPLRAAAGAAAA